jgi:hypothetical protein
MVYMSFGRAKVKDGGPMELQYEHLLTELEKWICAKGLREYVAWRYCRQEGSDGGSRGGMWSANWEFEAYLGGTLPHDCWLLG